MATSNRRTSHFITLGVLSVISVFAAPQSSASHLPEQSVSVVVAGSAGQTLRDFLSRARDESLTPLPSAVEQALLSSLPAAFRTGCNEMIEMWGSNPDLKPVLGVRWVYTSDSSDGAVMYLACRCSSTWPDYAKSFDERLAVLREINGRLVLQLLAHEALNIEDNSVLTAFSFAGTLPLPGMTAIGFQASETSENPCCDGGPDMKQKRTVYFVALDAEVRPAVFLVNTRLTTTHSDVPDGDATFKYRARWHPVRDPQGSVTEIVGNFRYEIDKKLDKSGALRYRWNAAAKRFDASKAPPRLQ